MKDLGATASGQTTASIEDCFAQLSDLESYPRWYPTGVRGSEVLERDADGKPTTVKTTLHISVGPMNRDFKVHLAVTAREPDFIDLKRLPKSSGDREEMQVTWRLSPAGDGAGGTHIRVDLKARLSVPPLLPVGGVADGLAKGFLNAALDSLK
jgi:ribosome-associated toxin RatA of RatAB toxin-antitoxin module